MNRRHDVARAAGLAVLAATAGCAAEHEQQITVRAADGQVTTPCGSACARPEPVEDVDDAAVRGHLAAIAKLPVGAESQDVDELLFHGAETSEWLDAHGTDPLSAEQAAWLRTELARDRVQVGFRLVDADGTVLGHLEDDFPLVEHQDFLLRDTPEGLGRVSMNGKVKRVGVDHLWARFLVNGQTPATRRSPWNLLFDRPPFQGGVGVGGKGNRCSTVRRTGRARILTLRHPHGGRTVVRGP